MSASAEISNELLSEIALAKEVEQTLPNLVHVRISKVYAYTAGMFAASCASAWVFAKSGLTLKTVNCLAASPTLSLVGLLAIGIGLLFATLFTAKENAMQKHGLLGMFTLWEGFIISPLVLLNGTAFAAATATTVAVVGSLAALAMKLQESFAKYEKVLMVGLGAIALASLGALCLPAAAAAFSHEVSFIGGLALFSALVIYDTHIARQEAVTEDFDEVNHSINIYLDAVNLLIRIWECYDRMNK